MGIFDEGFLPEDRAKRMKRRQEIRMCYNREEWARRQALLCHVFELPLTIVDSELKLWLRLQLRS
jgi:hypothetical protein